MHIKRLHSWNVTPKEAVQLQRKMASRIDARVPLTRMELIAGADIGYDVQTKKMYATVLVFRLADDQVIETQDVILKTKFPYVPGLLTFREAPALLKAFAKLKTTPDVVMIDGQGLAHPRRIGLASHVGLWLDLPTIGCAKSRLIGTYKEPAKKAGSLSALMDKDEQLGYVVRTRERVKPLFISVGHKIDLASAVYVVLSCVRRYRIPEPTRLADIRVGELRRKAACGNRP
ncbi:MAG TPA: deoxyribonuclease V [Gemmataceae bacterium]|jgi:deoxyribonuclease V|nr:deoxyribonuclease V [Gemmataceae bacterium]